MKNNKKVHESIAEAFGRTTDPLAEYNTRFKNLDADPFDLWLQEQIYSQDYAQGTVEMNKRRIDQWRKYMQNETDRHPAVPTTHHVIDFARYYLDEHDNSKNTVKAKLGTLSRAFQYFQNEPAFPHPTDFNPFNVAKGKIDLNGEDSKPHHPIPL